MHVIRHANISYHPISHMITGEMVKKVLICTIILKIHYPAQNFESISLFSFSFDEQKIEMDSHR